MKKNKGAISIFALLSMMFFLIFIMVAYNNVMQKAKTQVETEEILVDYYKSSQTAEAIYNEKYGSGVAKKNATDLSQKLKEKTQKDLVNSGSNVNKFIFSNGKIYKITN